MRVAFNSQERTLQELTDLALMAGWKVVDVIRKPEGSLFGSIVAVPVSIPHSRSVISPMLDQDIYERCASPIGNTFYSKVELPKSPGRDGFSGTLGDSPVIRMKKKIRKTLSRTFGNGFGALQAVNDEKQRSSSSLVATCFPTSNGDAMRAK
jgi:hypothetical protein